MRSFGKVPFVSRIEGEGRCESKRLHKERTKQMGEQEGEGGKRGRGRSRTGVGEKRDRDGSDEMMSRLSKKKKESRTHQLELPDHEDHRNGLSQRGMGAIIMNTHSFCVGSSESHCR